MKDWLGRLLQPNEESNPGEAPVPSTAPQQSGESEGLLREKREVQALRMELADREHSIAQLKEEVERLRGSQSRFTEEAANTRMEALFTELASPVSQILTQAALLEDQDIAVQPRDILSVARRMIRALERRGMHVEGTVGQQVAFDPNRHALLEAGAALETGQMVRVRVPGISYLGKFIQKAIVE